MVTSIFRYLGEIHKLCRLEWCLIGGIYIFHQADHKVIVRIGYET